jgi:hypothetical protein
MLVLTLPTGSVELTVTQVRFERQGEAEDANFLVGAWITDMSQRDRVRFIAFIRELASRA